MSTPVVYIRPAGRFAWPNLIELWQHRQVLNALVWRNVARRYRQTLLGPVWFVISPLMRMIVFSLILGKLAGLPSDGVPYPIFTYTALLPWEMFVAGINRGTSCLVTYQSIISKLYFPRLIVPLAEVCTALIDFFLSFGILVIMMLGYGFPLTTRLFFLPVYLAIALVLSLGIGLFLATLFARFRDVSNMTRYGIQIWFYGTPVAYSAKVLGDNVPGFLRTLYDLNPMLVVVEGFRWAVIGTGIAPDASLLWTGLGVTVFAILGALFFLRTEHSIVDLI